MEVWNLTAVLNEDSRDIENVIAYKCCLNTQLHDCNKIFFPESGVTLH